VAIALRDKVKRLCLLRRSRRDADARFTFLEATNSLRCAFTSAIELARHFAQTAEAIGQPFSVSEAWKRHSLSIGESERERSLRGSPILG